MESGLEAESPRHDAAGPLLPGGQEPEIPLQAILMQKYRLLYQFERRPNKPCASCTSFRTPRQYTENRQRPHQALFSLDEAVY